MKPVRHLAADIALLKVGETSEEDVIVFLGEPDEKKEVGGGVSKWLYVENEQSLLNKTPLIGNQLGSATFRRAVVSLKDGVVTDAVYNSSDSKTMEWADDTSWQVEKQ